MKFIHYLEKISGVSIYALSSLILFGLVFLAMTIWAFKADKKMIEEIKQLPLDNTVKILVLLGILIIPGITVHAEGTEAVKVAAGTSTPIVAVMLIIIAVLGMAIALLANVLLGTAQMSFSTPPPDRPKADDRYAGISYSGSAGILIAMILAATILTPAGAHAQDGVTVTAQTPETLVPGLSNSTFYMMAGVIVLEVLIMLGLLYNIKIILALHKKAKATVDKPVKPLRTWWAKANSFKPIEQEVDTGHDYDGIRELDNKLPPWWLYGFYCTIIFAFIYLWRYHVAHSAPLSHEELAIEMQNAEIQKAEYLKKSANNVDETTVKQLTDPADLAAGRAVFESTCFACHGKEGQGGVGPNLTDDYWLHGGSIQEVFKTIKYGWPDKGMKSWKDDFSPSKIAQIASYVKSLQGSHPANPKPPQGALSK